MSFLDKIFRKPHPSDNWQASEGLPLVLDLDRHALCDVRPRDPVEWLSRLGPPEGRKALDNDQYCYYSRGIESDATGQAIEGFVVVWNDVLDRQFQPFAGIVKFHGREHRLGTATTEADFVAIFGEPFWRDRDEIEVILFYEFRGDIEWQVEFTLDDSLKEIIVTTPPIMSNSEQRAAYSVTKPWPPESY